MPTEIRPNDIILARSGTPAYATVETGNDLFVSLVIVTIRRVLAMQADRLNFSTQEVDSAYTDSFGKFSASEGASPVFDFSSFVQTSLQRDSQAAGLAVVLQHQPAQEERFRLAISMLRDFASIAGSSEKSGDRTSEKSQNVTETIKTIVDAYNQLVTDCGFNPEEMKIAIDRSGIAADPFIYIKDPIQQNLAKSFLAESMAKVTIQGTSESKSDDPEVKPLSKIASLLDGWRWSALISDGEMSSESFASADDGAVALSFFGFLMNWYEANATALASTFASIAKQYHSQREAVGYATFMSVFHGHILNAIVGPRSTLTDPFPPVVKNESKDIAGGRVLLRSWFCEMVTHFILLGAVEHGLCAKPTVLGMTIAEAKMRFVTFHTPRLMPRMADYCHVYGLAHALAMGDWLTLLYKSLPAPASFVAMGEDRKDNKRHTWQELTHSLGSAIAENRRHGQRSISSQIAAILYDMAAMSQVPALAWAICMYGKLDALTPNSASFLDYMSRDAVVAAMSGPQGLVALFSTVINFVSVAAEFHAALVKGNEVSQNERLLSLQPPTLARICVSVHHVLKYAVMDSGLFSMSHRSTVAKYLTIYRNRTESNAPGTVIILRNFRKSDPQATITRPLYRAVPVGPHAGASRSMASWCRMEKDESATDSIRPLGQFNTDVSTLYPALEAMLPPLGSIREEAGSAFVFGHSRDGELAALALATAVIFQFSGMSAAPEQGYPRGRNDAKKSADKQNRIRDRQAEAADLDMGLTGIPSVVVYEGVLVTDTRGAASYANAHIVLTNVQDKKFEISNWLLLLAYAAMDEQLMTDDGPMSSRWYKVKTGTDVYQVGVDVSAMVGSTLDSRTISSLMRPASSRSFMFPKMEPNTPYKSGDALDHRALCTKVMETPRHATFVVRNATAMYESKAVFENDFAHDRPAPGEVAAPLTTSAPFGVFQGLVPDANKAVATRHSNQGLYPLMPLLCECVSLPLDVYGMGFSTLAGATPGKIGAQRQAPFGADSRVSSLIVCAQSIPYFRAKKGEEATSAKKASTWSGFNNHRMAMPAGAPCLPGSPACYFVLNYSPMDALLATHDGADFMEVIDLDAQIGRNAEESVFHALLRMIYAMRQALLTQDKGGAASTVRAMSRVWLPDAFVIMMDDFVLVDTLNTLAGGQFSGLTTYRSDGGALVRGSTDAEVFESFARYANSWISQASGGIEGLSAVLHLMEQSLSEWISDYIFKICTNATVKMYAAQFQYLCGVRLAAYDNDEAKRATIGWRLSTAIWLADHTCKRAMPSRLLRVLAASPNLVARVARRLSTNNWQ